jgi:hypothetical protein
VDSRLAAQKVIGRLLIAGLGVLILMSIWVQMVYMARTLPNPYKARLSATVGAPNVDHSGTGRR